jgi:MFS family permease
MSFRLYGKLTQLGGVFKATIVSFIAILAIGIYDFILPIFTEGQSDSFAIVGLIVSLVFVASLLSEIPIGLAVDKYGRIKTILLSMLGMGILGIVYFYTQNLFAIALLSLAFGTVAVAFWIPSTVLIRDFSPRRMLSQAQGIYMTITQGGWIVAPIIAGIVAARFSDRHNFLAIAALMFVAIAAGLMIFKGKKAKQFQQLEKGHKHKPRLTLVKTLFKEYLGTHKHAGPVYALTFAIYIWIAISWTFVAIAGIARFGFTEEIVGFLFGAMMAVQALIYYTSGFVMDKIGKKYIITAGFLLLFAASYFMFLSTTPAVFIMSALIATGTVAWVLPGTEALLTEIIPPKVYGEMSGVFDTSKDLGLTIGPLSGGLLATYLANPLAPFLFVVIVSGAAALLSGYVFWPQKRIKGKPIVRTDG